MLHMSPSEAFKSLLDETVLHAVDKDYSQSMDALHVLKDVFCDNNQFSIAKTARLGGAISIGVLTSIFAIPANAAAVDILKTAIKEQTGVDISYGDILLRLLQIGNLSGSAALATFSAMNLIETYFGPASKAEKYLKKHGKGENCDAILSISKKILSLFFAVAANVPGYFMSQPLGIPLALTTSIANIANCWFGVMPLMPARLHPALRIELHYLNEQIAGFLRLPTERQNTILSQIKLRKHDDYSYKDFYARLLNLSEPDHDPNKPAQIFIQEVQESSCPQKSFSIALSLYMIVSQVAFIEATYVGISRLFADTNSAEAISTGSIAALFSALPAIGFPYTTGNEIANALRSENLPLAKLFFEKSRESLKCAIDILAIFSGGTAFAFGMKALKDITDAASITGVLKSCLEGIYGTMCYTTGSLFTAYYMLRLCDEILIYFAQRCTEPGVRELFTFVFEVRRMQRVLSETSSENYLEILRWKMQGNSNLSHLMHAIFNERMSTAEYEKTRHEVNASIEEGVIMRDQPSRPAYRTVKSFVKETPEWQARHPGLRRRQTCCLFSASDDQAGQPALPSRPSHQL